MKNDPITSTAAQKKIRKTLLTTAEEERVLAKALFEELKLEFQACSEDNKAQMARACIDALRYMTSTLDRVGEFVKIQLREQVKDENSKKVSKSYGIEDFLDNND